MEVAKGRHLLQEMVVDHYIRNETKLEGGPDGQTWSSMASRFLIGQLGLTAGYR